MKKTNNIPIIIFRYFTVALMLIYISSLLLVTKISNADFESSP